jgi:hypothetical protein
MNADRTQSRPRIAPDDEAAIVQEMKWVSAEARALMFAPTDPERTERLEQRKRNLLERIEEWSR